MGAWRGYCDYPANRNANVGFAWQMISAWTEISVCLVCLSFPGPVIKKLRSSWRLLFTQREIRDKELHKPTISSGDNAKNNLKRQWSTKDATHPVPGTVALGG